MLKGRVALNKNCANLTNEIAWPISSLVVDQHYNLKLTVLTDNYISVMLTVTTRFDTEPTTSSNHGNKKSNPALRGKALYNLTHSLDYIYHRAHANCLKDAVTPPVNQEIDNTDAVTKPVN